MNTKRLMKTKADDASPETTNSKSKKSIQLADTSSTPAMNCLLYPSTLPTSDLV